MTNTVKTFMQIHYSGGRKEEVLLEGLNEYVVGRSIKKGGVSVNDVGLDDQFVSRKQCRIFWSSSGKGGNWVVEDLGSSNGTKLNGFPVLGPTPIPDNGEIYVGASRLIISPESANFPRLALTPRDRKTPVTSSPVGDGTMMYGGGPTMAMAGERHQEDGEATMLAFSSKRTPVAKPDDSEEDGPTMVLGRSQSGGDATLLRSAKTEEEVLDLSGGNDATVLRSREDDATMVRSRDDDATMTRSRDDATVIQAKDENATVTRSRDGDATVTRTVSKDATLLTGGTAPTLTLPASKPAAKGGGATILPGQQGKKPEAARTVMGTTVDHTTTMDTEATISDRRGLSTRMVTGDLLMTQSLNSGLVHELLEHNYLDQRTAVDLLQRARQTGQPFFTILARESSSTFMEQIYQLVAQKYRLPTITDEQSLSNEALSSEWLPFSRSLDAGVVLLQSKDTNRSRYATIDPFNIANHDWVVRCSGKPADKVLVSPNIFVPTLNRLREKENQSEEEVGIAIDITADEEMVIREQISEVDVPQMVNFFLHRAHVQRASDIHIEPTEDLLLVRNRVDGILHGEISLPMAFHPEVVSRLKILSGMDVAEKRRPQDGRFGVLIRDNPIDIRVSSYPTVYGEKFVLRLLDKNALRPSIEALGLLARDLRLIKDKLKAPFGLIVISGPTGSGKTTTLYSCLASMDKE
ncbi:MAG: Flp pilus assembly complex ATPase component TadA, partial [Magnetococcales bacterium]|nr:Flp pilus assembly complex ATPase component TadA [Magnetococcales bacterium]